MGLKGTHSPIDPLQQFVQEKERAEQRTKLLKDVQLKATLEVQEVNHGLGQVYIGFCILGTSPANVVMVCLPSESSDASKRVAVKLLNAVACTTTLLVYF